MKFDTRQLIIVAIAVVVVVGGAFWFFNSRQHSGVLETATADGAAASAGAASTQADSEIMVAGPLGEMGLGDPNAPNVVIEYMSLTCPHCQAFHANTYDAFKAKYIDTGKVYFILREYPLDPLATAAAVLARCAPADRFFPLIDLMFDRQREWAFVQNPKAALENLVKQAGITPQMFEACLTNQQILDGVNWVKNRGTTEFNITGTPTFFVNGQELNGEKDLAAFDQMLGG